MAGHGVHVHGAHDHAVALAWITVLTQKRWLLVGAGIAAFGGAALGIVA
jgi:hypothetical protein